MRFDTTPSYSYTIAMFGACSLLGGCDFEQNSSDGQETGEVLVTDAAEDGSSGEASATRKDAAPTAWQPDDLVNLPSPPSEKLFPPDEPQEPDDPQEPLDESPVPPVVRRAMTWTLLGQQKGNIHVSDRLHQMRGYG